MNTFLRQIVCMIIFGILSLPVVLFAQTTAYQPEGLVKKVISELQVDITSVPIKDNDGNTLDVPAIIRMLQSGKYAMETYVDEQDQIKEVVLRPKSNEETVKNDQHDSKKPLKDELEKIRIKDQALRKLIATGGCIENTYGNNSEEFRYFIQLMVQEDKKNLEQIVKIIDENGWLGISQVGESANNTLFLVIQHASIEIQEKYFSLLKESAEKGESKLADMALMDDRIQMYLKKKQIYGSQTVNIKGKNYVWPIEDPKNVDARRKNVQLPPLNDYLKLMGLSYPQDELPTDLMEK